MLVLVTGATGEVGSKVVKQLLLHRAQFPQLVVRALVRDLLAPAAVDLACLGALLMPGEYWPLPPRSHCPTACRCHSHCRTTALPSSLTAALPAAAALTAVLPHSLPHLPTVLPF